MALVRDITIEGVHYPEAYSRILVVRCDKDSAYVYVCTYSDIEARFRGDNPVWTEEPVAALGTVAHDVFPASYAFLKTQPGFENAVDHNDPPELVN